MNRYKTITKPYQKGFIFLNILLVSMFVSCSTKNGDKKEEQIRADITTEVETMPDSMLNSIQGNVSMSQMVTTPNSVLLTGLADHRLITIYKSKVESNSSEGSFRFSKVSYDYDQSENEGEEHFMPGIDVLYGYNLLNIAHYDLKNQKMNYLFKKPALIKTLYYPASVQDTIDKKPIVRHYYLVSVYDEDTNKDTIINKKDLRHFYLFDSTSTLKTQLIPNDYSVIRSQYDSRNDVMYLYSSFDENKNGTRDKKEPIHLYWINLKSPAKAIRMY